MKDDDDGGWMLRYSTLPNLSPTSKALALGLRDCRLAEAPLTATMSK